MAKYDSAIPYIQKAEGGLSRATTDSASKYPSPYVHNGLTGWHTNRGITYQTFEALSKDGGYTNNQENFIKMPDSIWLKIYRTGFWDAMKGDKYNSQAIANAVVDFAWASGTGGATKSLIKFLAKKGIKADGVNSIVEGFNKLTEKGDKQIFNELIDHRKDFFNSLGEKSNPGGAYTDGWMARMEKMRTEGLKLVSEGAEYVKRNWLPTTLIVTGTAAILIGLVMKKQ